jgi:uncharacterized membrane protein YuzA (DUF378 family)
LWPHAPKLAVGFLGVTLAATIFGNAISLREMMYWMPGVACYLVPAALMLILFVELFASAAHETPVARPAVLAGICFLVGLCNEFTPVWLLGMIMASFLFRRCSSHPFPQDKEHALLFGATVAGFASCWPHREILFEWRYIRQAASSCRRSRARSSLRCTTGTCS